MKVEDPASLVAFVRSTQNVDHQLLLFDAYAVATHRYQINLATQLAFIAYVLAEIELDAPTRDLVAPAIALMIDENRRTLELLQTRTEGHA
jgi:hypothetical protein